MILSHIETGFKVHLTIYYKVEINLKNLNFFLLSSLYYTISLKKKNTSSTFLSLLNKKIILNTEKYLQLIKSHNQTKYSTV